MLRMLLLLTLGLVAAASAFSPSFEDRCVPPPRVARRASQPATYPALLARSLPERVAAEVQRYYRLRGVSQAGEPMLVDPTFAPRPDVRSMMRGSFYAEQSGVPGSGANSGLRVRPATFQAEQDAMAAPWPRAEMGRWQLENAPFRAAVGAGGLRYPRTSFAADAAEFNPFRCLIRTDCMSPLA